MARKKIMDAKTINTLRTAYFYWLGVMSLYVKDYGIEAVQGVIDGFERDLKEWYAKEESKHAN